MADYLLLDGYNLTFRSYYAIRELTRADGFPTNAIHGWVRALWKLMDDEQPSHVVAFFDLGASEARVALHPEYKANRAETPEDLKAQVPFILNLTAAMGIPVIMQQGIEADDLLAATAVRLVEEGKSVAMVSADKDLGQVIRPGLTQLLPPPTANPRLGWRKLDSDGVKEKFGIAPEQVADYLALIGDSSDNIPGLKGVGPKTAVKWLAQYESLDTIIAKANYLSPPRFQGLVRENAEQLRTNLKLVQLDLSLECPDAHKPIDPQPEKLFALLEELEMKKALEEARKRYG